MENKNAYRIGKSLRKAADLVEMGRTAFEAMKVIRGEATLFDEMRTSADENGTLCGNSVNVPTWVENLVITSTYVAEIGGIYEIAWRQVSNLLLPAQVPTTADRVREILLELGIRPDAHQLINPCLPEVPLFACEEDA